MCKTCSALQTNLDAVEGDMVQAELRALNEALDDDDSDYDSDTVTNHWEDVSTVQELPLQLVANNQRRTIRQANTQEYSSPLYSP